MQVNYLNPSRPFQWQNGGNCLDVRNGAKVDPDACEGNYGDWYKAQQAAKATGVATAPRVAPTARPAWMLPAAVVGIGLLAYLAFGKK